MLFNKPSIFPPSPLCTMNLPKLKLSTLSLEKTSWSLPFFPFYSLVGIPTNTSLFSSSQIWFFLGSVEELLSRSPLDDHPFRGFWIDVSSGTNFWNWCDFGTTPNKIVAGDVARTIGNSLVPDTVEEHSPQQPNLEAIETSSPHEYQRRWTGPQAWGLPNGAVE